MILKKFLIILSVLIILLNLSFSSQSLNFAISESDEGLPSKLEEIEINEDFTKFIAVSNFETLGIDSNNVKMIRNRIINELVTINKYKVVERSNMEKILKEQKFQNTGCTNISCAVEIGVLIGADLIVIGSIGSLGELYSIDSRLVDVEFGEVVKSASYTSSTIEDLLINGTVSISNELCNYKNLVKKPLEEKQELIEEIDSLAVNILTSDTLFSNVIITPKSPGRAMLYSGLLPGLGQAYLGTKNRSLLFAGIEAITFGTWYHYKSLGDDQTKRFQNYANDNWSFARWIHDYYKWNTAPDSIRIIFLDTTSDGCDEDHSLYHCYPDIWEASHNVSFTWENDEYSYFMKSSDIKFEAVYNYLCDNSAFDDQECNASIDEILTLMEEHDIEITLDHHFYENIGKYDDFFAGWYDNDDIYLVTKSNSEPLALSPKKQEYRNMWDKANDEYYKVAGYAISTLMANHVSSMLDALLSAKFINMKNDVDISAQPYYDRRNKWGVGGVKLIIKW